jgi:hypothetical protein
LASTAKVYQDVRAFLGLRVMSAKSFPKSILTKATGKAKNDDQKRRKVRKSGCKN